MTDRVVFDVVVTDNGTARPVIRDVGALGAAVENTGRRQRDAANSARDFYDTQKKGIIGTANSTKNFSKLAESMGGQSSGVVAAYATLAANVFAVTAAFNALKGAAQVEQLMNGLEALGERTGRSLDVAAQNVKELSGYTLSAEQSMRSTAQVISAGFSTKQLERITTVAKDASFALGRDMQDSMDRLSRGIIKLEPELLDELGIMTRIDDATSAYAITVGKAASALTQTERRIAFANAALAEGELKFADLSDAAGNTRAYDELAATFKDLTQTMFSAINTVMIPIVQLLASSPTALLGVMTLFASTLSKQMLPGLVNLSKQAALTANETRKSAAEEAKRIQTIIASAKAEEQAAMARVRSFDQIKGGPKVWNSLTASINASGTASADYQRALSSLDKSLKTHERQLAKLTDAEKIATKTGMIENIRAKKEALENLAKAEAQAAESVQTGDLTGARNSVKSKTSAAFANLSAATAIDLAGAGSYRAAYAEAEKAVKQFGISQMRANGGAVTALGTVRTAAFAASVGVKALGAAFLNMIPVIGQAILVAGLLYEGFKWITKGTKDQQLFNEKMDELNSILENFSKRADDYARFQNSIAPANLRQSESYNLISNSITEIIGKYDELMAIQAKAEKATRKDKPWEFTGIQEWMTGIDNNDVEFVPFRETDVYKDPGFKAFKALYQSEIPLIQKTAMEAITRQGGLEKAIKFPERAAEMFAKALKDVNTNLKELGPAAAEMREGFNELEKSFSLFIRGSAQNTSYDKLVTDFGNVTRSSLAMKSALVLAGEGFDSLADSLQGIGSNTALLLNVDTQKALDTMKKFGPEQQALLQKQADLGGQLGRVDLDRLNTLKAITGEARTQILTIDQQLAGLRQQSIILQEQERNGKNLLALANARLKSIGTAFDRTGAGLKAQYAAEDRIRGIQIQQNNNQIQFLKLTTARTEQNLKQLEIQLEIEKSEVRQLLNLFKINRERFNASRNDPNLSAEQRAAAAQAYTDSAQPLREAISDVYKVQQTIQASQDAIRDQQASIRGLATQNQALQAEALNNAQRQARINEADTQVRLEQNKMLQDARGMQRDILDSVTRIGVLQSGRPATLRDELNLIKSQRDAQVARIRDETANNVTALQAERAKNAADVARLGSNQELIAAVDSQIAGARALGELQEKQVELTATASALEKVIFDDRKEGLEWQSQSLDMIQKAVDAQRQLSEETQKTLELRTRLAYKRAGLEMTAEGEAAIEINAATQAFKLARDEASLRKGIIDLEYALLEAQRQMLMENIRDRKDALAAQNNPAFDTQISQLSTTIQRLESVNTQAIADNLKKAVDQSIQNARLTLETAITPDASDRNGILARMRGRRERAEARRRAQLELERGSNSPDYNVVRPRTNTGTTAATVLDKNTIALTSSNTDLVKKIQEWIGVIERIVRTTPVVGQAMNIADAAKKAVEDGFRVSEMQGYGGVGNSHKGRGHYENRAFDMNIGYKNTEASNPEQKAKFDEAAKQYQASGLIVLWNGQRYDPSGTISKIAAGANQHIDHMHVEIARGAQRAATAQVVAVKAVQEQAIQAAAEIERDIVVSAPRSMVAANDNALASGNVPIDIPEVDVVKTTERIAQLRDRMAEFTDVTSQLKEQLLELGPAGEAVAAVIQGLDNIGTAVIDAIQIFQTTGDFADRFTSAAAVVGAAVGAVQQITGAASQAKIDMIDKEIAAEQKRDGKSAESVAKIIALEKKKDAAAKKQFNLNKKLMMAQAIIATATAVVQALTLGPIVGPIMATVIGALGAAQLAIIAGTSYQSSSQTAPAVSSPSQLSIGKRGDSVDVAKNNNNVGGELGYLRGAQGRGTSSANYQVIGSKYGGPLPRGYGNARFEVGENGPEVIEPVSPVMVRPVNDNQEAPQPFNANFTIQAMDSRDVQRVLTDQRGNIISMLREAANANGQRFLEDVDTNVYTRPNVSRL